MADWHSVLETVFGEFFKSKIMPLIQMKNEHARDCIYIINKRGTQKMLQLVWRGIERTTEIQTTGDAGMNLQILNGTIRGRYTFCWIQFICISKDTRNSHFYLFLHLTHRQWKALIIFFSPLKVSYNFSWQDVIWVYLAVRTVCGAPTCWRVWQEDWLSSIWGRCSEPLSLSGPQGFHL